MPSPAKQLLSGAVAKPQRCLQQNSEQREHTRHPSGAHALRQLSTMTHQEGSGRTGNTRTEPNSRRRIRYHLQGMVQPDPLNLDQACSLRASHGPNLSFVSRASTTYKWFTPGRTGAARSSHVSGVTGNYLIGGPDVAQWLLFFCFFLGGPILWCSHSGEPPQTDFWRQFCAGPLTVKPIDRRAATRTLPPPSPKKIKMG
jgi:hypothetical protein